MKRKLIQQGKQALTLTLPISWIRNNGLTKDSEIEILPQGKNLVLSSGLQTQGRTIKLDFTGLKNRGIYSILSAAYTSGVDEIQLTSETEISSDILKAIGVLPGLGIIRQDKNNYVISDIQPGFYTSLEEIFKRIYQMVMSNYDSAIIDIFGEEKETKEGAFQKDMEINKFCYYLQRAVNKMAFNSKIEENVIFTYSKYLENIGDEIRRMWYANIKGKVKKSDKIKKLTDKTKQVLEKSFFLYFQYNKMKVDEIFTLRNGARKLYAEIEDMNPETIEFVRHIVNIAEIATDLTQLAVLKNL